MLVLQPRPSHKPSVSDWKKVADGKQESIDRMIRQKLISKGTPFKFLYRFKLFV